MTGNAKSPYEEPPLIGFGLLFAAGGVYGLLDSFQFKTTLSADAIELAGLRGRKQIRYDEIAGIRVIRIFRRAGLPPWPVLFLVIPVFGFAVVGSILAFTRWPKVAPRKREKR
jgi:hypothetical protein